MTGRLPIRGRTIATVCAIGAAMLLGTVFLSGCTISCTIGAPSTTKTTVGPVGALDTTTAPPSTLAADTTTLLTGITITTLAPAPGSETTTAATTTPAEQTTTTGGKTSKTDPASTSETKWVVATLGTVQLFDPWTRYEETDSHFQWVGTWQQMSSSGLSGGSMNWSNSPQASVAIPFNGTQIRLVCLVWKASGIAGVALDDQGIMTPVDTYENIASATSKVVWTSPVLPKGTHYLRIFVLNQKNPASVLTDVNIDSVEIVGRIGI
jgi:hypothetical protein